MLALQKYNYKLWRFIGIVSIKLSYRVRQTYNHKMHIKNIFRRRSCIILRQGCSRKVFLSGTFDRIRIGQMIAELWEFEAKSGRNYRTCLYSLSRKLSVKGFHFYCHISVRLVNLIRLRPSLTINVGCIVTYAVGTPHIYTYVIVEGTRASSLRDSRLLSMRPAWVSGRGIFVELCQEEEEFYSLSLT